MLKKVSMAETPEDLEHLESKLLISDKRIAPPGMLQQCSVIIFPDHRIDEQGLFAKDEYTYED